MLTINNPKTVCRVIKSFYESLYWKSNLQMVCTVRQNEADLVI